jgi:hypothetical protein
MTRPAHRRVLLLGLALLAAAPLPARATDPMLALMGAELLIPHMARGGAFARPQLIALALAQGDPEIREAIAAIGPLAERGAPSRAQLRESFADAAARAVAAEAGIEEAGAVGRWAAATMRFGAGMAGGGTPALTATGAAEARLAQGDLAGALMALAPLEAPATAPLAAWRAEAEARVALDVAAVALSQLVGRKAREAIR